MTDRPAPGPAATPAGFPAPPVDPSPTSGIAPVPTGAHAPAPPPPAAARPADPAPAGARVGGPGPCSAASTAGHAGRAAGSDASTAGSDASAAGSAASTAGSAASTAGSAASTAGSAASTAGSDASTAGSDASTAGSDASTAGRAGAEPGAAPLDYADLDLDRAARRGYPEAVFCAGKTPAQVAGIAATIRARPDVTTLFTRAEPAHAAAVLAELPDARHDADAALLAWPPTPPPPAGGLVVVIAAGTSDLPVAREAELTARYLGRPTELVVDAGVAGLHRILRRLGLLRRARAVVVAAGMDGALPSVVAGLIPAPVIALPTSVGYGAAFGGLAPLLSMVNACAPGVAVVNIDNGYGAGHLAAQIAADPPIAPAPPATGSRPTPSAPPDTATTTLPAPDTATTTLPAPDTTVASRTTPDPARTAPATPDPAKITLAAPHAVEPAAPGAAQRPSPGPGAATPGRHAWIDVSAGVAGDMLLGALLDAGAGVAAVQRAVDAVVPQAVRIGFGQVTRAGLRAGRAYVEVVAAEPPRRAWTELRAVLAAARLPAAVRERALAVFARLAQAEARVHGIEPGDVHFHEVGALDAIADVVGCCAALHELGVTSVSAGPVALGSGRVRGAHGELPVPAPAVAELALGWRVCAGGPGELATPTGMALLRTFAPVCEDLPAMTPGVVGVGAGGRDRPDRANVVRMMIAAEGDAPPPVTVLLEANVDDLDPRLWPGVLAGLLDAGAADAWLTPIVMKKGRPAHTLGVLCPPERVARLRDLVFEHTSTLGIRESVRRRTVLERCLVPVRVAGEPVMIKVGHRGGVIVQAMPEFEEVAALARRLGRPQRVVLRQAAAAAEAAGLTPGAPAPAAG